MAAAQTVADRAVRALEAVLPAGVVARAAKGGGVVIGKRRVRVVWAGEGTLGDARRVLDVSVKPVVAVAHHFSPGARELLSSSGVGWVDETGAAEVVSDAFVVLRPGRVQPKPARPPRWTPSVVGVAEALLCGTRATVEATVEATGLSMGSCGNALRTLTDLGLLEASEGRGPKSARRITSGRALLDAYASAAASLRSPLSLPVGVTWRDPVHELVQLGEKWKRLGVEWAATASAAASVLAPYLGAVTTVEVYVNAATTAELEALAAKTGLRPIEGGRLTLRPFPSPVVARLARTVDDLQVVAWPRAFADLRGIGVRGEEAAEHLWEVVGGGGA